MFQFLIVRLKLRANAAVLSGWVVSIPYSTIKIKCSDGSKESKILFQFLIVRLKSYPKEERKQTDPKFQFLIVRLKSDKVTNLHLNVIRFQFLIVRLKFGCHQTGNSSEHCFNSL